MTSSITIIAAPWATHSAELQAIRRAVFVVEQQVPESEEWDVNDPLCRHVLAYVDGQAVGCGRLLPDGHIGRMAVLQPWRAQGVGRALLVELINIARGTGHAVVVLHAQTHAMRFYEKLGFAAEGAEFMEAGIPHYVMRRAL